MKNPKILARVAVPSTRNGVKELVALLMSDGSVRILDNLG